MWTKARIIRPYRNKKILSFEEEDLFWRKVFWESLLNLIEHSDNESLVISVDAPWWEWKTHFLLKWKSLLEEKERKVIYFDSFKNDYMEDPFTALLWEVMKVFEDDKTNYEKITEKWTNVLKSIIPLAWKIWARVIFGWDIKGVEEKLEEIIEGEIAEWIHSSLKRYIEYEDTIESFKKTLQDAIQKHWKIVFIIDELDRCRPDFAMRLLERVKHFFDIPGLYFVLGINKPQLISYVTKIYWNIDNIKYLQKFIDIETILPINRKSYESPQKKYLKSLLKEYRDIFLEKNVWEDHHILRVFSLIIEYSDFSLRDIEKAFNYLILCQKSINSQNLYISWELLAILFCLKVIDVKYIKAISNGENLRDEIIEILKINKWTKTSYSKYLIVELWFLFGDNLTEEMKNTLSSRLNYWNEPWDDRHLILLNHIAIIDMFNIW